MCGAGRVEKKSRIKSRKIIVPVVVVAAIAISLIGIYLFLFRETGPKTWHVDDDGSADFHTIQDAIHAANTGDTIFVHNGTYYENVVINKSSLSLIGENIETTAIDGNGVGTVIDVTAGDVSVRGFEVRNSGDGPWDSGIRLYDGDNCEVVRNIVCNNHDGIWLRNSDNSIVGENMVNDNDYQGIWLDSSDNCTVTKNTVKNNYWGITVYASGNNVTGNTVTHNEMMGLVISDGVDNNIGHNTIANNDLGISLTNSSYNTFIGNTITSNKREGINMYYSDSNSVFHNNIINNPIQANCMYSANVWDAGYPSGGNYWSDYTGVDLDHNGIGDTPYAIDGNNQDNYPLTSLWVP